MFNSALLRMRIFLIVLFLSVASLCFGQSIEVGLVTGFRMAQPVFDDAQMRATHRAKWSPGGSVGISGTMKASELFSLTTELRYVYQRKNLRSTDEFSYFHEQFRYVSLPALFRYSRPLGHYHAYALLGPVVNYWLGGKGNALVPELVEGDYEDGIDYTIHFEGQSSLERFYVSDPNRWQLGIQIGGGVAVPMKKNFLKIDLRYEWGHTNLAKGTSTYSPFIFYPTNLNHTFHNVAISCSYVFSFDLFALTHKGKNSKK